MNLILVISITSVLLLYSSYSYKTLSLAADLASERSIYIKNFYLCEGLFNYGKLLIKLELREYRNKKSNKNKSKLGKIVLYFNTWPKNKTIYWGKLILSYSKKKGWLLTSNLLNKDSKDVLCSISGEVSFLNKKLIISNWRVNK